MTIGQVTEIKVLFNPETVSAQIPVMMELNPSQIEMTGPELTATGQEDAERLIKAGLRAQLQSQSLLTGLLFVNLDFRPDAPARLVGGAQPFPEIPTMASELEQLQQTAGDVAMRLPGLVERLNELLTNVDATLKDFSGNFRSIVADVASVATMMREQARRSAASSPTPARRSETSGARLPTLDQILTANAMRSAR